MTFPNPNYQGIADTKLTQELEATQELVDDVCTYVNYCFKHDHDTNVDVFMKRYGYSTMKEYKLALRVMEATERAREAV